MNVCFLEGFLVGKKPIKVSANGKEILPFGISILVNPQANNPKEKTTILNCVAFDRTAHHIDDATNGGANSIHVQTTYKVNCYTDRNGNEHVNPRYWVSSAACHTVQTNKSAHDNGNNSANNYANKQTPPQRMMVATAPEEDGLEDFV
jgi:single-stranded DNA-binding protein